MAKLDSLTARAGNWTGTYDLWLPMPDKTEHYHSSSTATITPILGDKFVRVDYTWAINDEPQEGSILCGYEPSENHASAVWVDSWHNADAFLICRGTVNSNGAFDVLGSYPAPEGPDWGWRTELQTVSEDTFRIVMYNLPPGEEEQLAVEATYTRVP